SNVLPITSDQLIGARLLQEFVAKTFENQMKMRANMNALRYPNSTPKTILMIPITGSQSLDQLNDIIANRQLINGQIIQTRRRDLMSPEEIHKFSVLLNEIKDFSHNNCDLIVDYEWLCIIHNLMFKKGFCDYPPQSWQIAYKQLIRCYVQALKTCESYEEVMTYLPLFEDCNRLLFNKSNGHYEHVMDARRRFLNNYGDLDNKWLNLRLIVKQQSSEHQKSNDLQTVLENNVNDIKGLNVLIHVIKELDIKPNERKSFERMSTKMNAIGLNWSPEKCRTVLNVWVSFYANNFHNLEYCLQKRNRIVEYIYGFLNAITTFSSNLKSIYRPNDVNYRKIILIEKYVHNFNASTPYTKLKAVFRNGLSDHQ
ncbi:unnamed protein product, partial [Oppiella nova]